MGIEEAVGGGEFSGMVSVIALTCEPYFPNPAILDLLSSHLINPARTDLHCDFPDNKSCIVVNYSELVLDAGKQCDQRDEMMYNTFFSKGAPLLEKPLACLCHLLRVQFASGMNEEHPFLATPGLLDRFFPATKPQSRFPLFY